ncbi:MAG: TldD/PmbA family protein [Clostridia bacterium]|nr:TldD/PmbA family protein [Clostridia bacterium]
MNFEQMKEYLIAAAKAAGLTEYEIYATSTSEVSTETYKDEISSFSSGESGGISFRCIVDGKMGYASGELLTREEMEALVDRAIDNAKNIETDDEVFIFPGSESYEAVNAKAPEMPEAATLKNWALDLQAKTYAAHPSVSDGTQTAAIAFESNIMLCNSHGLELSNHVGSSGVYISAVVKEGDEAVSGFKLKSGRHAEEFAHLPAEAVEEARGKLGATTVESGKYDCVIAGDEMRSLLSAFWSMFSAKMVQHGMSLLGGRIGEKIASDIVNVTDDPRRPECDIQTSFDGEGVATYRKSIIENGELRTYLYDLTTAKKDGVASTGNGQRGSYASSVSIAPYCCCLEAGDKSLDELFATIGDGLYITELKGIHAGANAVTGDFSLESAGFRIRDGKIAEAVKTFTIAGNFLELLKSVDAIGNEIRFGFSGGFTSFASADVLVRGISVAGK